MLPQEPTQVYICIWCEEMITETQQGYWRFDESRPRGQQCNQCRRAEVERMVRKWSNVSLPII